MFLISSTGPVSSNWRDRLSSTRDAVARQGLNDNLHHRESSDGLDLHHKYGVYSVRSNHASTVRWEGGREDGGVEEWHGSIRKDRGQKSCSCLWLVVSRHISMDVLRTRSESGTRTPHDVLLYAPTLLSLLPAQEHSPDSTPVFPLEKTILHRVCAQHKALLSIQ